MSFYDTGMKPGIAITLTLVQSIIITIFRLFFIVTGWFIVPIGLIFERDDVSRSDGRAIKNLPKWLWIYGNDHDGTTGDKRGWWDENAPFGLGENHWFSKWWWTALRNPANNLRHVPFFSAPVRDADVVGGYYGNPDIGRNGIGYCLTWAKREDGWYRWFGFIGKLPYSKKSSKCFYLRFGFKFWYSDILDKDYESNYGQTFRISFTKDRD